MALAGDILAWYDQHGRKLPWRAGRDPYAILVSEIMLQQTQVPRVIPKFQDWMARFPTWQALAAAPTADLLQAWSGLGYNRRALRLRDIAVIIGQHGVPASEDEWRELPGIGAYTAAALTVFSLGQRATPIDTNIRRIGGRVLLGRAFPEPAEDALLRPALEELLAATARFPDLVQALFDLASLICRPQPLCRDCPAAARCRPARDFQSAAPPLPPPKTQSRERKHRNKPFPDRIYRGRILRLVATTPNGVPVRGLGPKIDADFVPRHDRQWLTDMIARLARDGLLEISNDVLTLPR